jgi:dihydrofolate reductase
MREHLTSIVAIDQNGGIGCQNRLPWALKSDMAFFRRTTMAQTVIMGRKTYESIGGCLPGRNNLILTRKASLYSSEPTCIFTPSITDALVESYDFGCDETFVIGGSATYLEFAELVDRYIVTFVDFVSQDADAFLSNSIRSEWSAWDCEEIASYPSSAGRDQFSFKILAFTAPNAKQRSVQRKNMVDSGLRNREFKLHKRGARPEKIDIFQSPFTM